MKKSTGFLLCSFILLVTNGCAIKEYTSSVELYNLPPAEQMELCQKWSKILSAEPSRRVYYEVQEPADNKERYDMQSAYMVSAGANFGAALGEFQKKKNKMRAEANIGYCTERHFSKNLPEGYALSFLSKSKNIDFVPTKVDQLNIKATKLTLAGDYANSLELTNRALNIKKNPYSYKIQGVTYILAAQKENNTDKKRGLFNKSVDSFNGSFDIQSFTGDPGDESAAEYFLRGYAKYQINQDEGSYFDLSAASSLQPDLPYYFAVEKYLYQSLIFCVDSKVREKVNKNTECYSKAGKQYGSYCRGFGWTELAERKYKELPDYAARESWLKESLVDAVKICKGDRTLQNQFSKRRLEMPSESFLKYLDRMVFRGFASN